MNDAAAAAVLRDFRPHTQTFAQDPYSVYAKLQKIEAPIYYPDFDMWLVSRYVDVARIARDRSMVRTGDALFSVAELEAQARRDNWHDMPYHSRFVQFSLLDSEGDVHERLRKQVFMLFAPGPVSKLRDAVQRYVDERLDAVLEHDITFDFVEDLAASLPGYVVGTLMGVPAEDCPMLRVWSERIVQFFDVDRSDEKKALAETTTYEFYCYLNSLKRERQKQPRDDLLSRLVAAEAAGSMSEDEFVSTCMLIVMAGHGSTLDVLGTGLYGLLRFPKQMRRLREDQTLMKSAVQEMFRFESPLPFFHRYNTQNVVIGDRQFAPGTRFGLLYGAANRDPSVFTQPELFDVGRLPNRHLAFGGGAHFCLGNHLARLNMDVLFSSLLERTSSIDLVEDSVCYKQGLSVRGLERLPIRVRLR